MSIDNYKNILSELCRQRNVKALYVFGSVLTNRFNEDSDVDFIVSFNQIPVEDYADNYFELKFALQDTLQRPVDLLEEQAIKNPYFLKNIIQNRKLIYG